MMHKAYKYRLYPSKSQVTVLNQTLEQCRLVYNRVLEIRKTSWEQNGKNVRYYETKKLLPLWKQENRELKNVHSQVLQDVVNRVETAYAAFFRRVKLGENPGYPRFKGYGRYDSITYMQNGFKILNGHLILSKIGDIRVITHRTIPENCEIKTCTIRRSRTGKWFASISVCIDQQQQVIENKKPVVGIDVGLTYFATLSNGEHINNPMFLKNEELNLSKSQRKLSKQDKGTSERRKFVMIVSRIHERIANRRNDFAHKLSKKLVENYGLIVFEDLNISDMVRDKNYSKSIHDVAWNTLIQFTKSKAEDAGSKVVLVDPRYTSQKCSVCGHVEKDNRKTQSNFTCLNCGHTENADINAAKNILGLGLQSIANTVYSVPA
jgi:putative transposase